MSTPHTPAKTGPKEATTKALVIPVGAQFGYWTTTAEPRRDPGKRAWRVRVRCRCGTERTVESRELNAGRSQSCGCRRAELPKQRRRRPLDALCRDCEVSYVHTIYRKDGMWVNATPFCKRCGAVRHNLRLKVADTLNPYRLFLSWGSRCDICKDIIPWASPTKGEATRTHGVHVDHAHDDPCDHQVSRAACVNCFRGFLCSTCNMGFLPGYEKLRKISTDRLLSLERYLIERPLKMYEHVNFTKQENRQQGSEN